MTLAKCQFTLSAFIARAISRRTRLSPSGLCRICPFYAISSRHTKERFKNDEIKKRSILRLAKGSFCKKF
ncbi:hypothetical protein MG150_000001 [Campylobacter upsaliensis]|nr:hypothetical protein [Campylobacter upsaliensis]